MIIESFYLTQDGGVDRLSELTDLSLDEIEQLVGRFRKNHYRFAGKLKGEVLVKACGQVVVRHHFSKKIIWEE